jgi:hypothetical protein
MAKFTDKDVRNAVKNVSREARAEDRIPGTIISENGRHVFVVFDGEGGGAVWAHRGIYEPIVGARVTVEKVPGTEQYKVVGVADDALAARNGHPYDFERIGPSLYYPLALEALNNAAYNLGTDLNITIYNIQYADSDGTFHFIESATLDLATSVPVADSRWAVVYVDVATEAVSVYDAPTTATPDGEWVAAVNLALTDVPGTVPLLAIRLNAGATSWPDAWKAIGRGYSYDNKRIIRIPYYHEAGGGGAPITDAYYQTVQENGVSVVSRPKLNFTASGTAVVTVADDGTDTTNVNIDATGLVKENFTELDDTPASYFGEEGKLVRVNATEDGLEFADNHAVFEDFGIAGDTGTGTIADGETLGILGSGGIDTAVSGNDVTISLDINELTAEAAPISGDFIPFYDVSAGANRKLDIDTLPKDFDINGLVAESAIVSGDFIPFYDVSAGVNRKIDFNDLPSGGGGGAVDFTDLNDVPTAYTGESGKFVAVKATEDGLEFVAPPSGTGTPVTQRTMTLIYEETLVASGVFDVSSIVATHRHLFIELDTRTTDTVTADQVYLFHNTDTTVGNYHSQGIGGSNNTAFNSEVTAPAICATTGASAPTDEFGHAEIEITNYANARPKQAHSTFVGTVGANNMLVGKYGHHWSGTAAIDRIRIQPDGFAASSHQFAAGSSIRVYGIGDVDVLTN